jgi:hypothetical protein
MVVEMEKNLTGIPSGGIVVCSSISIALKWVTTLEVNGSPYQRI